MTAGHVAAPHHTPQSIMTHQRDTLISTEGTNNSSRSFAFGLAAVTAIALILRLYHLGFESLWYDELRQTSTYQLPLRHLISAAAGHGQPPLDYLIGFGLDKLGLAASDWWVRLPAALFGTASVALIGLLVKRMAGSFTAITAAGLLAVCPLHVVMSQEARPYTIFIFSALVTLLMLDFARRRHTPIAWMLFAISTTFMILTRWVGPQVVIVASSAYALGAWWLERRTTDQHARTRASQKLWAYFSAITFAYAVYGPIFGFILDGVGYVIDKPHTAWLPHVVEQLSDAYQAVWGGYSTSVLYGPMPTSGWLLVGAGLLTVIGIIHTITLVRHKPVAGLILAVLLPYPFLYAALYAKMTSIHAKPQYLLLASVPLAVLVAAGLERVRVSLSTRRRTFGSLAYAALLASLLLPMGSVSWSLLNRHDKRDWRGLMSFLKSRASADDAFAVASADTIPTTLAPVAGGKGRYGMGFARFLPIGLETTPESLVHESWHHPRNVVWIVGIKDRLYQGSEQLPTPTGVPDDMILRDFPGVFVVGIPGTASPARRLARGIEIITTHLPEGSAVVAPHLLRGRLLLAQGDITNARSAFDEAARQCRTPQELETLIRDYLPQSIADRSVSASQLK